MNKSTLLLMLLLGFVGLSYGQGFISVTERGSASKDDIGNEFGLPIFAYGATYYKVTYASTDAKGNEDVLSGLMLIPDGEDLIYPVLMYEHGTSSCKTCVPSRYGVNSGGDEGQAGLLFAGMGYIALLPDYVGMGDGNGFQTYVHKETSVSATEDMLNAFKAWAAENEVAHNDQLFVTGYSQGGYASMAFHMAMQDKYGAEFITAATHNSGPYSLSGAMRDLILVDSAYDYPAYIPNTMLGMNEVYEMYDDLEDFFEPNYIEDITKYYNDEIELVDLNQRIYDTLASHFGASNAYAKYMILPSVLNEIETDMDYVVNTILKENDVFDWKPESPTRIFYCEADDQVPYINATLTLDKMYANGADQSLVKAQNLGSTLDHGGCVEPAFTQTLFFFDAYKNIGISGLESNAKLNLKAYPNPAQDALYFKGDVNHKIDLRIIDVNGKIQLEMNDFVPSNSITISSLESGVYFLQIQSAEGISSIQKIVVQ